MANETKSTPTEAEFITAVEAGPLTQVEVRDATDRAGLVITAVAVDPDTHDEVPVSITLHPDGAAYLVTIAGEEIVVPQNQPAEKETSPKNAGHIRALRKLHELATKLEQEAKGKARELAERLRLKRNG